ncbi:uncharacterized protein LTR77_002200 [Saxophila tyrrhenica]|uniref:NADP-dependent mannitol dehydrogenase n=1 Tax=Saxophila tyrrhenica TaxID=1690608 RepID=A0AAV9PHX5_9PEZI|nr:hypothetical protein LTR77_002200 [Saxophila tyrrhenica]
MSMRVGEGGNRQPLPYPDTPSNVLQQFNLKGKTVVVNGAADGIGYAVVEAMAEAGADVALWYNSNSAAIEKAKGLADKHGVKAKAYQVPVTDPKKIKATMDEVVKDFGRMDCFVANAGMAISKPVLEMSLEEFEKLRSVNFDGVFYCAKYAGAIFKKQGFGNLIITSSISGHIVNVPVDQPVYNATKAAVTHLGKSLAREWREFARVNMVSPGFFDTAMGSSPEVTPEALRMTPLQRSGHTKEIKGLYLYLASDASSYQTGSDVIIDGGYTLP